MKQRSSRRGHGEGSIAQRKDGRWEVRVDLGWEGGRRRYKAVYAKTQAEAIKKLTTLRAEVRERLRDRAGINTRPIGPVLFSQNRARTPVTYRLCASDGGPARRSRPSIG